MWNRTIQAVGVDSCRSRMPQLAEFATGTEFGRIMPAIYEIGTKCHNWQNRLNWQNCRHRIWQNSQLAPRIRSSRGDRYRKPPESATGTERLAFGAEFAVGFGSVGGICRKLQKSSGFTPNSRQRQLRIPNLRQFQPKTACDFAKVPRSKFYDFGNHASFTICGL
jgi:hypothetical protein